MNLLPPAPGRIWSLQREWSRAFSVMLAVVLVSAIATVGGVWGVVDRVSGTARQLRHESAAVAALRRELIDHEEVSHVLLSDGPVDRGAFAHQQETINEQFTAAEATFPTVGGLRAMVTAAHQSWRQGLTSYGLWSTQLPALHGNHSVENPIFGASADRTLAMVDGLQGPSLLALDRGLAHGMTLERVLIATLIALFALASGLTVYFRRRMVRDLLHPVATMHNGVLRLQAGHYDHRIEVARHDELGELTEAFNDMAAALLESHQALTRRATHDSLTGLPNRASLAERLSAGIDAVADEDGPPRSESVLFIDVDDFKEVNDKLGHEGGDILLVQLAARLRECVGSSDLVARLGGDEFAIVVVEEGNGSVASEVSERILQAMRNPFQVGRTRLSVSVSIGVAQQRPDRSDSAELLRRADFAMYMAKGSGKSRYQLFDSQVHDSMVSRSALKTELALAVASGQLRLDYQPVVDVRTDSIVGVEALVRWEHPTLGRLAPSEFIAIAEETGDVDIIGTWVLETASRQVASWRRTMPHCESLWVSVNLSPRQLRGGCDSILSILADPAVQPEHVVLEVTETALADDLADAIACLEGLKRFGVRIAVDDFGSGYSSLGTLASLPADILKIDRSFVSGQATTAPVAPMLECIFALADKLRLEVIAEGIETPAQLAMLRDLGCAMGQGYLLGRPMRAEALADRLAAGLLLPTA